MGKNAKDKLCECADRLRLFREERGLSQEKVAEDIKISYATYKKIEKGETALSARYLCRLHEVYGISADEILFGESGCDKIEKSEIIRNCTEQDKMYLLLRLNDMRAKNKRDGMKNEEGSYFRDKSGG